MRLLTADELLHTAVKEDNHESICELLNFRHADPNFLVNGKTPLFFASPKAAEALLNEGADPAVECDGLLFYERQDFFQNVCENLHLFHILMSLYSSNFDLFLQQRKTGKSFVDYLNPEALSVSC